MNQEKLSKLRFWSANMDFALGTVFLLDYAGAAPAPSGISPTVYLVLTVISYISAASGLLFYMRGK